MDQRFHPDNILSGKFIFLDFNLASMQKCQPVACCPLPYLFISMGLLTKRNKQLMLCLLFGADLVHPR
jgi:hypothetical protein